MSKVKNANTLQCPSCGAPLTPQDSSALLVKCSYCGMTVSLPHELHHEEPEPEQKRETVERYKVRPAENFPEDFGQRVLIIGVILCVVFIFVFGASNRSKNSYRTVPTQPYIPPTAANTVPPPSFAKHLLTFGAEGETPGKFINATKLAVDRKNGKVIVTDTNSGRINIFDLEGNSISAISTGKDAPIMAMTVNADGQILLVHNFDIHIYDLTGKEVSIMEDQYFADAVVGTDGLLYTLSINGTLSRYNSDGNVDFQIESPFKKFANATESAPHLAVDGLGNSYLLGEFSSIVLKISAQGVFLDRFGGAAQTGPVIPPTLGKGPMMGITFPTEQPGTFHWAHAIGVDDYGRIYVGDNDGFKVFDKNGLYLGWSSTPTGAICKSLAFDNENHLYALTDENTVEKYEVPKPTGQ